MADASRFPHLALPFALTGAAAGWLSAGIVHHPVIFPAETDLRLTTAAIAAAFGAAVGFLIRRFCVRKRYSWEDLAPDPMERPASDSWLRHGALIFAAGAAVGGIFAEQSRYCDVPVGMLCGVLFTAPFVPVCAFLLAAARRAQRARLGSLVAGSDRRAIWGILAITLTVCTLEGLPDWAAPRGRPLFGPEPVIAFLAAAAATIGLVLAADSRALARARSLIAMGLGRHHRDGAGFDGDSVPRLDLGLGDDVLSQVARTGAVYRGRDRTLALVQGDVDQAIGALARARWRGVVGIFVLGVVITMHALAATDRASAYYAAQRCEYGVGDACSAAADLGLGAPLFGSLAPQDAFSLYEKGCQSGGGASCMSAANLYRGGRGFEKDAAMVAIFEYRAAQRGLCPDGARLVRGTENVCVDPLDARR